jgi:hypothetical protein
MMSLSIKTSLFRSNHLTRDQEDLLDAKTIFKYKVISKVKPGIPIVTELVCPSNLTYIFILL